MVGFVKQTLPQLFTGLPVKVLTSIPDIQITGITLDSRNVQPGNIFVALTGESTDGHRFIPDAIRRGAVAVMGTQNADTVGEIAVPYIQVEDARRTLAYLSAAFYNFPASKLTVIGVTGTDGKTTTSNLIYQILLSAGIRAGIISTINATIGKEILDTGFHVTTPEAPDVQRFLSRMVAAGLTHVVLETTSHGLAQNRVTGCEFDIGLVTNITHEHLDYHGTYESYRKAKARLFEMLEETRPKPHGNLRLAVLNRDDWSYDYLNQITTVRRLSYSLNEGANLYARNIQYHPGGLNFNATGSGLQIPISSSMIGAFNISNILAALTTTVLGLNIPIAAAQEGIAGLKGVPGRMEPINLGQNFIAIVDFAHTANALRNAIQAARSLTTGRVITVFGSAGLRDREKRRMMAETSADLADATIITAEDPRSESLDEIMAEMAHGAESHGAVEEVNFWRIPDRGDAIRFAIKLAKPGDLVMACGKGHEQSMCFGNQEYPWDDRIAMQAALAERLGVEGPQMPYLPTQGPRE